MKRSHREQQLGEAAYQALVAASSGNGGGGQSAAPPCGEEPGSSGNSVGGGGRRSSAGNGEQLARTTVPVAHDDTTSDGDHAQNLAEGPSPWSQLSAPALGEGPGHARRPVEAPAERKRKQCPLLDAMFRENEERDAKRLASQALLQSARAAAAGMPIPAFKQRPRGRPCSWVLREEAKTYSPLTDDEFRKLTKPQRKRLLIALYTRMGLAPGETPAPPKSGNGRWYYRMLVLRRSDSDGGDSDDDA